MLKRESDRLVENAMLLRHSCAKAKWDLVGGQGPELSTTCSNLSLSSSTFSSTRVFKLFHTRQYLELQALLQSSPSLNPQSPPTTNMAPSSTPPKATLDNIEELLKNDAAVKVAGCDVDGVLRGKLMNKKKFLGIVKNGFGYCPH